MCQFITNHQLKFIVVPYQPTNQPSIGPSGCALVGTLDAASKVHLKWEQSQSREFQNSNCKQTQFGATLGTQGLSVNQPMPDVVGWGVKYLH